MNSNRGGEKDEGLRQTEQPIEGNIIGSDNDMNYQEWKACNESITKLDSILIDLRKYGLQDWV